ncbi:MAG: lysoplasmalogenase [Fervidobacterium sp.]|uniref:lysoplasmalogenase n=1 Tax=Fervidobacterium sp. TaxID=1871331 RepID=UPI0025C18C50|nr:lysoplasmalogenase [Fervidobacterium sp.]NPU89959.1 lysoplasmalogenase [Fervidobacterium sp.]
MKFFLLTTATILASLTIVLKQLKVLENLSILLKVLTTLTLFLAVLSDSVFLNHNNKVELLVAFGLLSGALGDFFLEFDRFFTPGMGAFLLGHIFYVLGFYKMWGIPSFGIIVTLLVSGFGYFLFLKRFLSKEKLAVFLYVLAICTMVAFSSVRIVAFSGAILFFLSDLFLSYDKYVRRIPNRDLLVLSLYFAGQLFISLSVVL